MGFEFPQTQSSSFMDKLDAYNQSVLDNISPESSARAYASAEAYANSAAGKIEDFFTGGENARAATQARLAYEQQATNSARAWDEYMQSTYYQRMVEDLKKAGLNPWLALNSGVGSVNNYQSAGTGVSAQSKGKSNQSGAVIAGLLIAAARVIAALV